MLEAPKVPAESSGRDYLAWRRVQLVVCACLAIGSCRSASPQPGGGSATSPASVLAFPSDSKIENLRAAAEDSAFLQAAVDHEITVCMTNKGFEWIATPLSIFVEQARATEAEHLEQFPYNSTIEGATYSRIEVQNEGEYGVPKGLSASRRAEFDKAMVGETSDMVAVEVLGQALETPVGGCLNDARVSVFATLQSAFFFESEAGNAITRATNLARRSDLIVGVLEEWSACMSRQGFQFEEFSAARHAALANLENAQTIANADALCTKETNLVARFDEEYRRQLSESTEANIGELEELARATKAALMRAKSILGS